MPGFCWVVFSTDCTHNILLSSYPVVFSRIFKAQCTHKGETFKCANM